MFGSGSFCYLFCWSPFKIICPTFLNACFEVFVYLFVFVSPFVWLYYQVVV